MCSNVKYSELFESLQCPFPNGGWGGITVFPNKYSEMQESWRGSEHSLYHNLATQSQTGQPNLTIPTKDEVKFLLGYPWMIMVF